MKFDRIRDLREDNDLTQDYLGKVLNVSQRTYSRYENDERAIPIEVFSKLADFYNTSVDYLIGRTNVKDSYSKAESSLSSAQFKIIFYFNFCLTYWKLNSMIRKVF